MLDLNLVLYIYIYIYIGDFDRPLTRGPELANTLCSMPDLFANTKIRRKSLDGGERYIKKPYKYINIKI